MLVTEMRVCWTEGESLYAPQNLNLLASCAGRSARTQSVSSATVDYIVQDNQVVIVDEHTGRIMPGRRWSEGLHQAVEAKEGVSDSAGKSDAWRPRRSRTTSACT